MNGWIDRWTYGWMNVCMDEQFDIHINRLMDRHKNITLDGCIN